MRDLQESRLHQWKFFFHLSLGMVLEMRSPKEMPHLQYQSRGGNTHIYLHTEVEDRNTHLFKY
jgi:hypothetical protein